MTQATPRPLPVIDEDTKPFWDYCKQHELRVQKCLRCGELRYPPNSICPNCMEMGSEWIKLSGKGKVYSFIVVRRRYHPAFDSELPYVVAIIEIDEGIRLLSNVVGCEPDAVKIDMPVEVTFDDVSAEYALPKFRPIA